MQGRVIDTNRAYDPENRAFLKEKFGQTPCSKSISTSTAAYTFRKESQTLSIITICPAYLNEFKVVKYTGIQAVQAFMWNKASSALQKTLTTFNRRKIDLAALFDITMLHEVRMTVPTMRTMESTDSFGLANAYTPRWRCERRNEAPR